VPATVYLLAVSRWYEACSPGPHHRRIIMSSRPTFLRSPAFSPQPLHWSPVVARRGKARLPPLDQICRPRPPRATPTWTRRTCPGIYPWQRCKTGLLGAAPVSARKSRARAPFPNQNRCFDRRAITSTMTAYLYFPPGAWPGAKRSSPCRAGSIQGLYFFGSPVPIAGDPRQPAWPCPATTKPFTADLLPGPDGLRAKQSVDCELSSTTLQVQTKGQQPR